MNKPAKVATVLLAVFVVFCGYRAHNAPNPHLGSVHWSNRVPDPGSFYRVKGPNPPPIAPEATREEQAIVSAARLSERDLEIRGRPIVLTAQDQRTLSHAMSRKASNVHE